MDTRRRALGLLLGAATASLLPRPALAHRAHVTLTKLARSADARRWEIEHHLHRHDAEQVLQRLAAGQRTALTAPEGRAHIALHVEEEFRLFTPGGDIIAVTTAGADFGSDSMVVYQECAAPAAVGTFRVSNRIFQRFFPKQQNHVSVQLGRDAVLLELGADRGEATFEVT